MASILNFIEASLGYAFQNYRRRDYGLVQNLPDFLNIPKNIALTSADFQDNGTMPKSTARGAGGGDTSPQLSWKLQSNLSDAGSYAIIVQDIDVPIPNPITHVACYNIDLGVNSFDNGELNAVDGKQKTGKCKFGYGTFNRIGYAGPRPILNHGPHRYVFQVFALNKTATEGLSTLEETPNLQKMLEIMKGNVLGCGKLTGTYERKY